MSLLDKCNFLMIPSGYKANVLYTEIPNTSDGDFNVYRTTKSTRINKEKYIDDIDINVPRIDYTKTNCPTLKTEYTSTNLIKYRNFSDNYWTKTNIYVIGSYQSPHIKYPTGAFKLQATNNNGNINLTNPLIISDNDVYTNSIYIKTITTGATYIKDINNNYININDLIGETIVDNWSRYSLTNNSISTNGYFGIKLENQGDEILISFPQTENCNYASSLMIGTDGTNINRGADAIRFSSYSGTSESGVLYTEISAFDINNSYRDISLSDNTNNNRIIIYFSGNTISSSIIVNGNHQSTMTYTLTNILDFNKIGFRWSSSGYSLWVNGIQVDTDIGSTFDPNILTTISLNSNGTSINSFFGYMKILGEFNYLNDNEMIELLN